MKEFFTDILLDISDSSEKKASRVAIKILYFPCLHNYKHLDW